MKDKSYKTASFDVGVKNASMCDSRHKILETLKRKKSSVEELSESLGISPTAVRQHLTILEGDSLIVGEPLKHNMGRPKLLYSLTENAETFFPKRYHMLAEALLTEIASEGEEKLKKMVRNISQKMSAPYKKDIIGKNLAERMVLLKKVAEDNGGYVEIKKEKDSYYFYNYNCPLNLLSVQYPVICDIHFNLIRTIAGIEVAREKCIAKNDGCCVYKIG